LEHLSNSSQPYTDQDFPAKFASLVQSPIPSEYNGEWDKISWSRAPQIFKEPSYELFAHINSNTLTIGSIGDVYLLCGLACLAEKPDLIKNLFPISRVNQYGVYAVWLNITGIWRIVVVDDFFPV
jgi:hypothetical protein